MKQNPKKGNEMTPKAFARRKVEAIFLSPAVSECAPQIQEANFQVGQGDPLSIFPHAHPNGGTALCEEYNTACFGSPSLKNETGLSAIAANLGRTAPRLHRRLSL
jgi:hypothetical protein